MRFNGKSFLLLLLPCPVSCKLTAGPGDCSAFHTATAERPWINKGVLQCLLLFYLYRETERGGGGGGEEWMQTMLLQGARSCTHHQAHSYGHSVTRNKGCRNQRARALQLRRRAGSTILLLACSLLRASPRLEMGSVPGQAHLLTHRAAAKGEPPAIADPNSRAGPAGCSEGLQSRPPPSPWRYGLKNLK